MTNTPTPLRIDFVADVVCPWCGEILDEEAGERESEALQEAVEMTVRDASMGNVGYTLMAAIAGVSLLLASVCLTAIPWLWHTLAGATN